MVESNSPAVRECVSQLLPLLPGEGDTGARSGISEVISLLLARPDLLVVGADRVANHQPWSSYLYFDGDLSMVMSRIAVGRPVPVHDHGVWEAIAVYRGQVKHRMYQRLQPDEPHGSAHLELVEEAELIYGDVRCLEPPADIHGLVALKEDTYILGIHIGQFPTNRRYFQPEDGTYLIRNQRQWREASSRGSTL